MAKLDSVNYKGTLYDIDDRFALKRSKLKDAMTQYDGWMATTWDENETGSFREVIALANGMVLFGGHYIGGSGGGSEMTVGIALYSIFFGCMPIVKNRTTNAPDVPCISSVEMNNDSSIPSGTSYHTFNLGISEGSKCTIVGIGRTYTSDNASIEAGMYTAAEFRALVETYMSAGSKRMLENPVSVTVNGQTFNATCVGLRDIQSGYEYSHKAYCIYFGNEVPEGTTAATIGTYVNNFSVNGVYLVPDWGGYYSSCGDYDITVNEDMIFV